MITEQILRPEWSFSERELLIARLLYHHRLLSTQQLYEVVTPGRDRSFISQLLRPLKLRGIISFVHVRQAGAAKVWYLTAEGAAAVSRDNKCGEDRPYPITAGTAAGFLQAHTLAVNDVGISFFRAAQRRGHECGPFAWRHEISHQLEKNANGRYVQADALLRYVTSQAAFSFFIELDRSSTPIEELVAKLRRYATFYSYGPAQGSLLSSGVFGWRRDYVVFPSVLVVFKDGQRAVSQDGVQRRMRIVQRIAEADPQISAALDQGMHVGFTEFSVLEGKGPLAPIFQSLGADGLVNALGERSQ